MEKSVLTYVRSLESLFSAESNEAQAEKMARYMKNHFPFHGISAVQRRALQKLWMKEIDLEGDERRELVRELWAMEEREYQYAAVDWMMSWKKESFSEADFSILEWLITQKSWWDIVDPIGDNILGRYMLRFPEEGAEWIRIWRDSDNFWLQRCCMIFQLKYKKDTDFELLKNLILQFKGNKEFFIQKAIGWTLREYAKTNPQAVRDFIVEADLQGLAKREASKYL